LLLKTPCASDAYTENLSKKEQSFGNSGTLAQEVATGFVYKRGLLLTPTTREEVMDTEKFKARMEKYNNGTTVPNLATQIHGMLPTPTTRDYKGARSEEALKAAKRTETNSLPDAFAQSGKTSQLNPRFVAEMMGFPVNWTELPFLSGEPNQSKHTETQ